MPSLLLAPRLELQANNRGCLLPGAGPRGLSSAAPAPGWWGDHAGCGKGVCLVWKLMCVYVHTPFPSWGWEVLS